MVIIGLFNKMERFFLLLLLSSRLCLFTPGCFSFSPNVILNTCHVSLYSYYITRINLICCHQCLGFSDSSLYEISRYFFKKKKKHTTCLQLGIEPTTSQCQCEHLNSRPTCRPGGSICVAFCGFG